VTPFGPAGELDLDGVARLARWLVDNGNDGLAVTGTTGEGAALSDREKADLWRAVREAVTVPVIAGTGTASTAHTVELTRLAAEAGADAALVVTPYYNRPSQVGIEAHFRAAAEASTGREIAPATLARLAGDRVIAGLKDAAGAPSATAALLGKAPAGFEVYSGEDALTLPLLAVGAVGVISVASHWAGQALSEMVAMWHKGDAEAAAAVNQRLVQSYEFEATEAAPNPVPTKAMMRALGLPAGECRLPMGPTPEGLEDRAKQVWSKLHERPFTQAV